MPGFGGAVSLWEMCVLVQLSWSSFAWGHLTWYSFCSLLLALHNSVHLLFPIIFFYIVLLTHLWVCINIYFLLIFLSIMIRVLLQAATPNCKYGFVSTRSTSREGSKSDRKLVPLPQAAHVIWNIGERSLSPVPTPAAICRAVFGFWDQTGRMGEQRRVDI